VNLRGPIAILVLLGVVILVLTQLGDPKAEPTDRSLDPSVALRILAPDPARTVPQLARRGANPAIPPQVSKASRRVIAHVRRAGVDLRRDLLDRFTLVQISIERSCPPPAALACRPAVRILGRLRMGRDVELQRALRTASVAALTAAGFRGMVAKSSRRPGVFRGRVVANGETLARWRMSGGGLEIATGGLELHGEEIAVGAEPPRSIQVQANEPLLSVLLG
jgi:hypothetical protein